MSERTSRWIAITASAATLLVAVVTAVLLVLDGAFGRDLVSNVVVLGAVACYGVVGGLIASRLPRNACGWLLLLIGFGLVLTMARRRPLTLPSERAAARLRHGRCG